MCITSTDVVTGLVHQLTRITEEHRDVERQSEKDRNNFEHQMRDSEMTIEELHIKMERVLEEKKNETDDLQRQIEATNKQLAANRKFLEVSAATYDHGVSFQLVKQKHRPCAHLRRSYLCARSITMIAFLQATVLCAIFVSIW